MGSEAVGRHRKFMTEEGREERYLARYTILQAASVNSGRRFLPKDIQRAVRIVRHRRLVHPELLEIAGFKGYPL